MKTEKNQIDTHYVDNAIKEFLHNVLKDIMSVVEAECGSFFLFDSNREELVMNSFCNAGNLYLHDLRKKIGEGIAGKVAYAKMPILVKDINKDKRFSGNGFKHYKTNSFISIPLSTSKGLLGLINLADKSSGDYFSEKDFEYANTICKYACLNIDNFYNSVGLKQEKESLIKQKVLLEKYASVGKLAGGVVHEINNPLDGVLRYANLLINQVEKDSSAYEYLLEIIKGLNRIANITSSLLTFSRHIKDSCETKTYVDINKAVDDSLCAFKVRISHGVKIKTNYNPQVPRVLDMGVSHIFVNLIKNALDAMQDAGTLEITTDFKDLLVSVSFKDTGLGFSPELKDRIFEPFFTTKSMGNGVGLGLSMCNEIIKKYNGVIEVHSEFGKGSTFTVVIPHTYIENA